MTNDNNNVVLMGLTKLDRDALDKVTYLTESTPTQLCKILVAIKEAAALDLFTPNDLEMVKKYCRQSITNLEECLSLKIEEDAAEVMAKRFAHQDAYEVARTEDSFEYGRLWIIAHKKHTERLLNDHKM